MSTLAVVEEIMRETGVPMSVREIVERAGSRLPSKSKTPDTVVARDLSMNLKRLGEGSIFIRTSPGRYTLRALAAGDGHGNGHDNGHGDGLAGLGHVAEVAGEGAALHDGPAAPVAPVAPPAHLADAAPASVLSPLLGERAAPMPALAARRPVAHGAQPDREAEGGGFVR